MVVIHARKSKPTPAEEAHVQASAMVEEQYHNFDVVWAKFGAFPWWPGVLFYSWDAVNAAGFDLKQAQDQLSIPPPTMQTLPDGKQRLVYSVLIMFLDRFDCSVVEISPKTVCPFAINYNRLKNKPKKNGSGFNVALDRAMRLLHMSTHMTEEELDVAAPVPILPTEEELAQQQQIVRQSNGKRQKRSHPRHAAAKDDIDDDESGEEENDEDDLDFGSDYTDDDDLTKPSARRGKKPLQKTKFRGAPPAAASKKGSSKSVQRVLNLSGDGKKAAPKKSGKLKATEHIQTIDDGDEDFQIVLAPNKASAKPTTIRKKKSRKEGRIHHEIIDVDTEEDGDMDDDDFQIAVVPRSSKKVRPVPAKKQLKVRPEHVTVPPAKSKKKSKNAQVEVELGAAPAKAPKKKSPKRHSQNQDASREEGSNKPARVRESTPAQPLTLTPLSSIWTTREPEGKVTDDAVNAETFAHLAYKLELVWDDKVFTDETPKSTPSVEFVDSGDIVSVSGNDRGVGKRQVRSVQQSQIRQSMLSGNLDPHTMVQCEAYLPKGGVIVETGNSRSRGAAPQIEAPFEVVVHPDAVFVCDLHSHLATCEIIGFLGGRWDDATRTLYIQAAFPCRSLEIEGDDGSTDVEMDPGSEIELREIIQNAELEVVGWYHSHPAFAPDPSIRDIENQTSYQQLFQRRKLLDGGKTETSYPFVGLIVGTYDQRRDSPVGLFRYFHTREERLNSGMRGAVNMPYELVPRKRHYRAVLEDEKRHQLLKLPMYTSVMKAMFGTDKVSFIKYPSFEKDKGTRARDQNDEALTAKTVSANGRKKRKGSSDLTQSSVTVPSAKKKRGRPKVAEKDPATRDQDGHPARNTKIVDMTEVQTAVPDIIDLVTDASQELSQSQEQIGPSTVVISNAGSHMKPERDTYASEPSERQDPTPHTNGTLGESQNLAVSSSLSNVKSDGEAVIVGESSESQTESFKNGRRNHNDMIVSSTDDDQMASGIIDSVQKFSEATKSFSEEIVDDSSQSQDAPVVCFAPGVDEQLNRDSQLSQAVDEVVSASASSSSMRSDSSFSYDASQSQTASQSQSSPQLGAVEAPVFAEVEFDPYAEIEVIPSTEPPKTAQDSHGTEFSKVEALLDAPKSTSRDAVIPNTASSTDEDEKSFNTVQDKPSLKFDDEVVGDSGPDMVGHPYTANGHTKADDRKNAVQLSPVEDDISLTSGASPGETVSADPSSFSTGRRRNRKPSLTVRRHSAGAAPGANPTSGEVRADVKSDQLSMYGSVSSTKAPMATSDERTSYSTWDGMEIIQQDYFRDIAPVVPDAIAQENGDDKPVEIMKPEPTTGEMGADVIAPTPGAENVVKADVLVVDEKSSEDETQKVMLIKGETHGDPNATTHEKLKQVPPSSMLSVKDDRSQSRIAGKNGHGGKRTSDIGDAGFLVEPLERYLCKDLRNAAIQMGVYKRLPKDQRKKPDFIAAIKAFWREQRGQGQHGNGKELPVNDSQAAAEESERPSSQNAIVIDVDMVENEHVTEVHDTNANIQKVDDTLPSAGHEPSHVLKTDISIVTNDPKAKTPTNVGESSCPPAEIEPHTRDSGKIMASDEVPAATSVVTSPEANSSSQQLPLHKASPTSEAHAMHLRALRTKYGRGVYGCTEQVITLIDYYRDFHRRTDLYETWKAKISKVEKIEASLLSDVELINLPVALREDYVKDVIDYLRASWKLSSSTMR